MIFGGQGRSYTSTSYLRLFQTQLPWLEEFRNLTKKRQFVFYKSNNGRKKWKFKISCFNENIFGKFFFKGKNHSKFSSSDGPFLLGKAADYKKNIPPLLDEFSFRKNMLKKHEVLSFASKTKSAGRIYKRNLHQDLCLTLTRRRETVRHLNDEDHFFFLNRRGFHTSKPSLTIAKKKAGSIIPSKSSPSLRGWLTLEGYRIYPWSISGLETCVVINAEDDKKLAVTFDIGYTTRPSVRCQQVFISHGHMDHVSGLFQHATKRSLYNLSPAVYYVPPNLVETLRNVGKQLHSLSGTPDILLDLDIRPIQPGDSVLVTPEYEIRPFVTFHRVPSQGYLLYHRYKRLKPLYRHLRPKEIAVMENQCREENIYEVSWLPEVAFTGDTTFELFLNNPPADLLKVRVLILEATYLENVTPGIVRKARERGHTHLSEIIDHAHLFSDVERLVLIHLSDKYSSSFARDAVSFQMPPSLLNKVVIATLAKDRS